MLWDYNQLLYVDIGLDDLILISALFHKICSYDAFDTMPWY